MNTVEENIAAGYRQARQRYSCSHPYPDSGCMGAKAWELGYTFGSQSWFVRAMLSIGVVAVRYLSRLRRAKQRNVGASPTA